MLAALHHVLSALLRQTVARPTHLKEHRVWRTLTLFAGARLSFRAVLRVLHVLANWLGIGKAPCSQTVINWVSQVSKVLHEGVIYRHIILTVPAMFRTTFYQNAAVLLSAFMRCGRQCLDDFYSAVRGKGGCGRAAASLAPSTRCLPSFSSTSWR